MTKQAVFVVLRDGDGKVLLQQRANTGYLDGYWDFPSGHVERGEPLRDAAARELSEEAGISVRPDDLRLIHINQFFLDNDYVNYIFDAAAFKGEPAVCEPDKCSAIGWFAPDALPEQCVTVVRVTCAAGFGGQLTYSVTDVGAYQQLMGFPYTAALT